jgi:hypothetical protein
MTIASNWCLDLWKPLDELTLEEAVNRIYPLASEIAAGIDKSHLIDDYTLSRNIAKYGLKFKSFDSLLEQVGQKGNVYFQHSYMVDEKKKFELIKSKIVEWNI